MKYLGAVILILTMSNLKAQSRPVDTLFYKSNNIKAIFYNSDHFMTGHCVKVYYDSITTRKIADSVLGAYFSLKDISYTFIFSRQYLDSNIVRVNHFDYLQDSIIVRHEQIFTDYNLIGISNKYNSSNRTIRVFYQDSSHNKVAPTIAELNFSISDTIREQIIKINDTLWARLNFYNNFIKSIDFTKNTYYSNGEYIEFYSNGYLKTRGWYHNGIKIGLWKEFYKNGRLMSIGYYSGKWAGSELLPDFIKKGIWRYYDELGLLINEIDYK